MVSLQQKVDKLFQEFSFLTFAAVRDSLEDESYYRIIVTKIPDYVVGQVLATAQLQSHIIFWLTLRNKRTFLVFGRQKGIVDKSRILEQELVLGLLWELETVEKHNEQLLWNLFHEIRNPICGILNTTHLLLSRDFSVSRDSVQKKVELIADCTSTLLQLSGDILELHKLKENKIQLKPKYIQVRQFFQACAGVFHDPPYFSVSYVVHAQTPPQLWFDEVRVRQVIFNLLINARKYGSRTAVLRCVWDKEKLYCEIEDHGQGIPKTQFNSLFKVQTASESGMGIGLLTCRYLMKLMKGDIYVKRSEINEGTTFAFFLNAPPEASTTVDDNNITQTAYISASSNSRVTRILVVDDNKFICTSLQNMIEHVVGIKADIAENGVEAVLKFEKEPYHLLFIDLRMPQFQGFETANEIIRICKEKGEPQPLIYLISAFMLTPQELELCNQWKLAGFLQKPFQISDLYKIFLPRVQSGEPLQTQLSGDSKNKTTTIPWPGNLE